MIGKTRQARATDVEEVYDAEVGKGRGMLRRPLAAGKMRHSRRCPSRHAAAWAMHYWSIRWDLRGCEPHLAESVPHPNVHMIFENRGGYVAGVHTSKFSRMLAGKSQVFGIKFRPGGFRPFFDGPISELANRTVPVKDILGSDVAGLEEVALSWASEGDKVEAADQFFRTHSPGSDENIDLASQLVETILRSPEIKTVDDLVRQAEIGKRSLQRIFNEYVGMSPKWVIRRYRLHEVIEAFYSAETIDWPQLALDLGYFDQAHLINDFKSLVGYSPTEYQKLLARRGKMDSAT